MLIDMLTNLTYIDIKSRFKNRYPLLMIDVIEECEPGKWAKGYKNFTNNEWFFPAHFADNPNVPGSIMLESMLDIFCTTILMLPECDGKETADVKINNLLFKRRLLPGDRLDLSVEVNSFRRGVASGIAKGTVKGNDACSAEITICVPDLMIRM